MLKTPKVIYAIVKKTGVVRIRHTRNMALRAARQVRYEDKLNMEFVKEIVIQKYIIDGEPEKVKFR